MAEQGRPTKYEKKYLKKALEYLEQCTDRFDKDTRTIKVSIPTIEGFARFIGVNKTTLYEWEKKQPNFSNALDEIRTEQHDRLINNGLAGTYNSTIAKLVLSSNHGMAEKTESKSDVTHHLDEESITAIEKALDDV